MGYTPLNYFTTVLLTVESRNSQILKFSRSSVAAETSLNDNIATRFQ